LYAQKKQTLWAGTGICKEVVSCITSRVEKMTGGCGELAGRRKKKQYCLYILQKRTLWAGSRNNTVASDVKRTVVDSDICVEASCITSKAVKETVFAVTSEWTNGGMERKGRNGMEAHGTPGQPGPNTLNAERPEPQARSLVNLNSRARSAFPYFRSSHGET
jgi:hypothetical protein